MGALMEGSFAQLLDERVKSRLEPIEAALLDGRVEDMEQYRFLVGQRRALLHAREEIGDLAASLRKAAGDED